MNWPALLRLTVRFALLRFATTCAIACASAIIAAHLTGNLGGVALCAIGFYIILDNWRTRHLDSITTQMIADMSEVYEVFPRHVRYDILCKVFKTLTVMQFRDMYVHCRGTSFEYDMSKYIRERFAFKNES